MECPNCKLINPEDTAQCDCGCDLLSGKAPAGGKSPGTPLLANLGLFVACGVVAAAGAVILLALFLKY
jgi:hypothetical protein